MSPKQDVPLGAGDALRQPFAECPRLLHRPREEEEGRAGERRAKGGTRAPAPARRQGGHRDGDGTGHGKGWPCCGGGGGSLSRQQGQRVGVVPAPDKPQKRGFGPKAGRQSGEGEAPLARPFLLGVNKTGSPRTAPLGAPVPNSSLPQELGAGVPGGQTEGELWKAQAGGAGAGRGWTWLDLGRMSQDVGS